MMGQVPSNGQLHDELKSCLHPFFETDLFHLKQ